jgi:hypothetical protein
MNYSGRSLASDRRGRERVLCVARSTAEYAWEAKIFIRRGATNESLGSDSLDSDRNRQFARLPTSRFPNFFHMINDYVKGVLIASISTVRACHAQAKQCSTTKRLSAEKALCNRHF